MLLAAGVVGGFRVCGKSGPTARELAVYPSLEGTLCDVIAKAPPARPRGPLPSDPALAAWTEQTESALEEAMALEAMEESHDYGHGPALTETELACARKLWSVASTKLPHGSHLRRVAEGAVERLLRRDAGSPERERLVRAVEIAPDASAPLPSSSANAELIQGLIGRAPERTERECQTAPEYLSAFPANARLRRALILAYGPCLEDNFNSVDGEIDKTEIFMQETLASWPERAGLDFELLVATDRTSQEPARRTWMWLRTPFPRITLDLGMTGNALRVVRNLKKEHPEVVQQLLPVARKQLARDLPSNRRARWTAFVAYLEADAPDPGEPPEPALARALAGDERSARWALGFLPNELQEHAPRPFPYLRDPAVIKATVARAELVTTDEDRILVLGALAHMPPLTALPRIASWISSSNEGVWRAAMSAMNKQIDQLPIKADPGELEAGAERRKHVATLLAPHLDVLRAALAPRVCVHPEVIRFLADADDKSIDAEVLPCIEGKAQPDTDFLTTLFHACLDHKDLGWVKSGTALAKTAKPGDDGYYARRVAHGCATGED